MAQFVNLTVASGSLELVNTTENTSSAGYTWFDSVSGSFKYSTNSGSASGTWSTSGTLNTGRLSLAGIGVQNASLAVGGYPSNTFNACNNTEEYDGLSWSNGPVISNSRFNLSSSPKGSTNSGLITGGRGSAPVSALLTCTEEYDGASWSAGGALSVGRRSLAGAGTQNSTLAFGGCIPSRVTCTEEYNGASWASGGALPAVASTPGGTGTQNSALSIGGLTNSPIFTLGTTNEYNGTSWSAGGNFGAKYGMGAAGTQNEAIAFGGLQPNDGVAKEYDGTTWTTVNSLSAARYFIPGTGTLNAALTFGGAPGSSTTTQEYTKASCIVDL